MMTSPAADEKNIANALISGLANLGVPPTHTEVLEKARQLAAIFGFQGDLQNIVTEAMISVDTRMGAGTALVDVDAKHDDQWVRRRVDAKWTYTDAYEGFLRGEGWPPRMVQSLSDVTMRIVGHLQDPASIGTTWSRRGLVIGHVQSGKTANYTGLIARAADTGYKFIIVMAGIHNNLRKQTQQRIDAAFIGRSSDPASRKLIGVGLNPGYPNPATLTNVHEDFNKGTAAKSGWKINDFSKPIILVIKKNVSTLTSLHDWLKALNAAGDGRISDVPVLVIDDEADNASINTNKPDLDPTRTNEMIRRILGLFAKSCYVGYTATPFANIFINPDAYGKDVREELFPKDFIYCLDPPTSYFGPQKVFLDERISQRVLEAIGDSEELLPLSHKVDDTIVDLPKSLYQAFDEFIIARAIRNHRGQVNKHCSMMINVSRFVTVQRTVRDLLSLREKKIREAVRANYMMPDAVSQRNEYMAALEVAFRRHYESAGLTWQLVKKQLASVFDHMHLYVVNSKSDDILDFKRYEEDGIGLTAVAIGGLSLSRGVTIEGLTVSYMYRNTKMYDTLMQMGRWFGYRPGFEDLCRVFLSRESIDWYSHIALAAEELVQQIRRMRRDKLSPRDFGLYVMAHPDSPLLVTAVNKMRTGERVVFKQNLSGRIIESTIVTVDQAANDANFKLLSDTWKAGFGGCSVEATTKGFIFRAVKVQEVENFLAGFQAHAKFAARKTAVVAYLRAISNAYPEADVMLVSPRGQAETPFSLNRQVRAVDGLSDGGWEFNKWRVASRGDEGLGLDELQIAAARQLAQDDGDVDNPSDIHFREVRNRPLLMIHAIQPRENTILTTAVLALGVSFPVGLYGEEIEVVANRIWIESMQGVSDDPDAEDDFDE